MTFIMGWLFSPLRKIPGTRVNVTQTVFSHIPSKFMTIYRPTIPRYVRYAVEQVSLNNTESINTQQVELGQGIL
jgi:hypothetical protein